MSKQKSEKKAAKRTAGRAALPVPAVCPFRHKDNKVSGYAMVWTILYHHRNKGINKDELIARYMRWSRKPRRLCEYDVQVVGSSTQDGVCNQSIKTAAQGYWVERCNSWLKLHLVKDCDAESR